MGRLTLMATLHSPVVNKEENQKISTERLTPQTAYHVSLWKALTGLIMSYVIVGAFFIAHGAIGFAEKGVAARIIFFHVPCAVLSSIAYFVGFFYAARYLLKLKSEKIKPFLDDYRSAAAMELGFLFCLLATITGSIFAGVQWGSFWNWDPRETSIVVMLLLYASYLLLRAANSLKPELRARLSAVYAVVALVPAQFLIWAVPRILATMHPTTTLTDPRMTSLSYKMVLYPAFIAFVLLFIWLMQLRVRMMMLWEQHRHNAQQTMETDYR